jgi:hypothetical protein
MKTTVNLGWTQNGRTEIGGNKVITHAGEKNMDFPVPAGSTNLAFNFTTLAASRVGYCLLSNEDVTFKVNSSDTPAPSIALKANTPEISSVAAAASQITADVTELFITNATAVDAVVQVRILLNTESGS